MASASLNKIERAHQMYREGYYDEALRFYTEALAMTKTKTQNIALHSNRAACYLKLHDFKKAAEECTSVLELDHKHTGALMLRAQTLVTLKEYQSALFDVNRLIELNPSSEVYQNLQTRLKTQLICLRIVVLCSRPSIIDHLFAQGKSLAPIPESEAEFEGEEDDDDAQLNTCETDKEQSEGKQAAKLKANPKGELNISTSDVESVAPTRQTNVLSEKVVDQNVSSKTTTISTWHATPTHHVQGSLERDPNGWRAIPKPKGHSALDYGRWDRVDDDSSEEDDDDEKEDSQPQYRFRVRTVGVKSVK